jgi:hypothetical protein
VRGHGAADKIRPRLDLVIANDAASGRADQDERCELLPDGRFWYRTIGQQVVDRLNLFRGFDAYAP